MGNDNFRLIHEHLPHHMKRSFPLTILLVNMNKSPFDQNYREIRQWEASFLCSVSLNKFSIAKKSDFSLQKLNICNVNQLKETK